MIERHAIPAGLRLHPLRPHYLNASEVGAAAGVDPHKSRLALHCEKTGELPAQEDNEAMQRGRWLESGVVAALIELHPDWDIRYPLDLYLCDPETRQGCTPDAAAGIDGQLVNVQLKVVSRPVFERDFAEGPPDAYLYQTLQEGALTGADRSLLAALIVDTYRAELKLYDVPRHAAAEQRLRDIAAAFWARIARGERPPADVTRDAETVAAMFKISVPEPVLDLSGDNRLAELMPKRAFLKAGIVLHEKLLAEIDTEIKEKLGPAETALLPGWKILWKTQHREAYMVPASTRRPLLVNAVEQKEEAA